MRTAKTPSRRRAKHVHTAPTRSLRTVAEIMSRTPYTLRESDDITLARQYVLWTGVRHLPVVRQGRLVGVLSDRDLVEFEALHGPKARSTTVANAMKRDVHTTTPDEAVEDAAARMAALKVGCLPVLADGTLVGIVTTTDVLSDRAKGPLRRAGKRTTITASDLMTPDPEVVAAEMTVYDAANRMTGADVRHLPVVDDEGRIVGILSDRDVRAAIGDPHEAPKHGSSERDLTVEDLMAADPIRVGLDAPLVEIATLLANERIGALPVVDESDHPVGIVSTVDVLGYLARTLSAR